VHTSVMKLWRRNQVTCLKVGAVRISVIKFWCAASQQSQVLKSRAVRISNEILVRRVTTKSRVKRSGQCILKIRFRRHNQVTCLKVGAVRISNDILGVQRHNKVTC